MKHAIQMFNFSDNSKCFVKEILPGDPDGILEHLAHEIFEFKMLQSKMN